MPPSSPQEFREWSIAAVRLLQGVVYADEEKVWSILLASRGPLENYLARIGLSLVLDESEGYAFVRQWEEDEYPEGHEPLPRLIRKTPLGYTATILAVLLRDEFRRFEDDDLHNERCVIEADQLFEQWKAFFPAQYDEVRQRKELHGALRRLEDLAFVRKFADNPESWEVRRILKARLPAAELETLKAKLTAAAAARGVLEEDSNA